MRYLYVSGGRYRTNTKFLPKYFIRGAIRVKSCASVGKKLTQKKINAKKSIKFPATSHKNSRNFTKLDN